MTFLPLGGWETKLDTNLKLAWVTYWVSDLPKLNSMTSFSIEKTKSWDQFIISDNCIQRFNPNRCCSPWSSPAVSLQGCHWWVVVNLWISPQSFRMCGYFVGGLGSPSALYHKMACVTEYQESWGGHQHHQCLWVRLSAWGLVWLTESETDSVIMSQDRNRKERQREHATHDWEGFPKTTLLCDFSWGDKSKHLISQAEQERQD